MPRETTMAAPVSFSRWILIMSCLGDEPNSSQSKRDRRRSDVPNVEVSAEANLGNHDPGSSVGPSPKEVMMRFYNQPHRFYAGIDLHARTLFVCVLDQDGQVRFHQNLAAKPEQLLAALEPFREDLVVACECMFAWYWVADLCATHKIDFVLGHALFMKAIHGGKTKNDKIDAHKIATLLRGGALPEAYVYPKATRRSGGWSATRRSAARLGRLRSCRRSWAGPCGICSERRKSGTRLASSESDIPLSPTRVVACGQELRSRKRHAMRREPGVRCANGEVRRGDHGRHCLRNAAIRPRPLDREIAHEGDEAMLHVRC
jgi:hypothetical protein